MTISEFERLLAAALPGSGRVAITLTDLPAGNDLYELLDRAFIAGEYCGAPLVEIHAPRKRYGLDDAWRHARVRDDRDVLRLVFEGEDAHDAPALPFNGASPSVQPELRIG